MQKSITMRVRLLRSCCLAAGLSLFGCNAESNDGQSASGSDGQVTKDWQDFCVATFTSDVAVDDGFGETAFTARKGESYLLTEFGNWGGKPRVQIAYLTSYGPQTFDVSVSGGPDTFPFSSNCTFDAAVQYCAVFADIKVYDSEALSTEICSLKAGTTVPRDTMANSGYSAVDFSLDGPQTYALMLNSLGTLCGGAEEGYISVPQTTVLGVRTALVPVDVVLKSK